MSHLYVRKSIDSSSFTKAFLTENLIVGGKTYHSRLVECGSGYFVRLYAAAERPERYMYEVMEMNPKTKQLVVLNPSMSKEKPFLGQGANPVGLNELARQMEHFAKLAGEPGMTVDGAVPLTAFFDSLFPQEPVRGARVGLWSPHGPLSASL